jgi:hypothetical protein
MVPGVAGRPVIHTSGGPEGSMPRAHICFARVRQQLLRSGFGVRGNRSSMPSWNLDATAGSRHP